MYAGGTEVKRFSKPLTIKMGMSKDVLNPANGEKVKVGDIWPIWSLDDQNGQWTFESNGSIVSDADGKLSSSFSASHLSYWNFDCVQYFCDRPLTLAFNAANYLNEEYLVMMTNDRGYKYHASIAISDKFCTTFRPPVGNTKFVVKDQNYNVIAESPYFDACAAGTVTINMPALTGVDVVNVDMVLKGVCPNKPVSANISSWVTLYEQSKGIENAYTVYMVNGKVNMKVKNNTKYVVRAL